MRFFQIFENTILSGVYVQLIRKLFRRMAMPEKQKPFVATAETACVPANLRVLAIGDIHGMLKELQQLTSKLLTTAVPNIPQHYIFLGDVIDRGPESSSVIEHLRNFRKQINSTDQIIFLRGNHEQLMLDFLEKETAESLNWLSNGGFETLKSYGVFLKQKPNALQLAAAKKELRRNLPPLHLQFLKETRLSYTVGDYFFCHATIDPKIELDLQTPEDLLWSRKTKFLDDNFIGKYIVHGHTPVKSPLVAKGHINIDTGAYMTGKLTALILFGTERHFVTNKS
jgi:serine/threonine protein phosphatase 1